MNLDWNQPVQLFTDCAFSPLVSRLPMAGQAQLWLMVDQHEQRLYGALKNLSADHPDLNHFALVARYPDITDVVFSSTFQFNGRWEQGRQLVRHMLNIGTEKEMAYVIVDQEQNRMPTEVEFISYRI